ncbi:MAG: acylphosphatase [Thermoplasmataceae archaeon]
METQLITVEVRFKGKVQGVNFRRNASVVANSRGVSGWIRNAEDGSVEACFSGPEPTVMAAINECMSLPGAMVTGREMRFLPHVDYADFSIRY